MAARHDGSLVAARQQLVVARWQLGGGLVVARYQLVDASHDACRGARDSR